jgi:hypothetical protein
MSVARPKVCDRCHDYLSDIEDSNVQLGDETIHRYCLGIGEIDRLFDEISRLQRLLRGRDEFIVASGKWSDFVQTLADPDLTKRNPKG